MRGSDRCDEIVRLIDETLADAPAAAPRRPGSTRGAAGAGAGRGSGRSRRPVERPERTDLLAAVGEFLAGTSSESAPSVA